MPHERTKRIDELKARHGLGRRTAVDERDKLHPMRAALPTATPIVSRYWRTASALDQGDTPQCVAYAWTAFLLGAPIMDRRATLGDASYIQQLYRRAQQLDEWPGESYDGTSVRAGAKALQEQQRLSEYVWASRADDVRHHVLARGPVVLGVPWLDEMFLPDAEGYLAVAGGEAGGHAIYAPGYSVERDAFRLLNSWGASWGQRGRAWLRRADLQRLIDMDGEACSAIEVKVTP